MLILQHIWSRWTKAARGAGARRPRPAPAYPLPVLPWPDDPGAGVIVHEVRLLEREDFKETRRVLVSADDWGRERREPAHDANLHWRPTAGGGFALWLTPPWDSMRRTPWPARLPNPLIELRPGEGAVIDWNGRFMSSAAGSNRSYFYDQHRYAVACVEGAPDPELFLTLQPRKVIDLTTRIY